MSQNWSQGESGSINGSIEISPIEVDTHSISSTGSGSFQPRRSVQFSDKVQRFPESAPSSPKPTSPGAGDVTKDSNKTPLDIATESLSKAEPVKNVPLQISSAAGQETSPSKPVIDSHIDVKLEKQNDPNLVISFNSPVANSSSNFDQQQQDDKQKTMQTYFEPTADVYHPSSQAPIQPPHVKDVDNHNEPIDDKPFVTTVILNVEMVRTPKETEPEDDWDNDLVKVSFSTVVDGYHSNEFSSVNQAKSDRSGSEAIPEQDQDKPPRSPQFGESKEGLHRIDLTPLLNAAPSSDIANINASINSLSPGRDLSEVEENKAQEETSSEPSQTSNASVIEIPIQFEGQPNISPVNMHIKKYDADNFTIYEIPIIFGNEAQEGTQGIDKFGVIGHKIFEIPIQFDPSQASVAVDIPLAECGFPAITVIEIPINFDQQKPNDSSQEGPNDKRIEIPIQFEGQPPVSKVDQSNFQMSTPKESQTEIVIIFESSPETLNKTNDNRHGIEIPIQFEGASPVSRVDVPLSQYGTPPLTHTEIPIKSDDSQAASAAKDEEEEITVVEIPVHFENQGVAETTDNQIQGKTIEISTEDEAVSDGIEIPIHFEGQPPPKVNVSLSQQRTPKVTIVEMPIIFVNDNEAPQDENNTEITVMQFGRAEEKPSLEAENKYQAKPTNSNERLQMVEIPIQHEGQPKVQKVDIPLSQFGTPAETQEEIIIIFDAPNNEKTKNNEDKDNFGIIKNNIIEIPIQLEDGAPVSKADVPLSEFGLAAESIKEIPIIFVKAEENKQGKETEVVFGILPSIVIEIPIQHEGKPEVQKVDVPLSQFGHPAETLVNIPIKHDEDNKMEEPEKEKVEPEKPVEEPMKDKPEQPAPQAGQFSTKDDEAPETVTEIPITYEKQQERKLTEEAHDQNQQELAKVLPEASKNHEILQEPKQQEQTSVSPETPANQNKSNASDVIYQTDFAKPMVDDASTQSPKATEPVPESPNVKYQSSFAKPMDTEWKEQKAEPQQLQNIEANYQSGFAQPLNADDKSVSKPEYISQKSVESQVEDKPKEIPVTIEIQESQPVSRQPSKVEESAKKDDHPLDDKVESSLFSAPSPLSDDDYWIEVPPSGIVRDIPISIQKTDAPSTISNQATTVNQPSNGYNAKHYGQEEASQDTAKVNENTSLPSATQSQPLKSPTDTGIVYYEVPSQGEAPSSQAQPVPDNKPQQQDSTAQKDESRNIESKIPEENQAVNGVPRSPQQKYNDDSMEMNIQEYEEQLRKNTQEALKLVDKLVESSMNQPQPERRERKDRPSSQSPPDRSRSRSRSVQFNESQLEAQSYRVNPDLMQEPTSAILLPEHRLAFADSKYGLSIFNLHTKDLKRIDGGSKWRNPQSLIYLPRAKQLLVLCEYSEKEDGNYELFICRFGLDLEYINRVEAPVFIKDKEIYTYRLCHCHRTDCIYLAASTYNTGYVYELSPEGFWREVYTGRNKHFIDISIFAVIGPVTELMLVDTSKDYVVVISIYNSEAANTRRVAACEKPSALTIDEKGTVIIHDRCSCKVGIHSRLDNLRVHDIALVESSKCQLSAWDRLLAVLIPSKKDLRLYKY